MTTEPHTAPTSGPRRSLLRSILAVASLVVLIAVIALPALAADPTTKPGPPDGAPGQERAKAAKVPKEPITLSGTVATVTDAEGRVGYTMTVSGTTYDLHAGPPWFHGDNHPLKASVGKSVTITGERAAGTTDVDVLTVDGTAIRAAGKPPWAGGWMRVGKGHPGWSQEKADRFKEKFGDCFPAGQCKKDAAGES